MSLRFGTVTAPNGGLRFGDVGYAAVSSEYTTEWDGYGVFWNGAQVYWFDSGAPALTLSSASIDSARTSLVMTFNRLVRIGAGGSTGFALTASGGAVNATYQSGDGGSTLIYSLDRAVDSVEAVELAYTQPGSPAGNGIEDLSGNDLVNFSGQAVAFASGILPVVGVTVLQNVLTVTFSSAVYGSEGLSLDMASGDVPLVYDGGQGTNSLRFMCLRSLYGYEVGFLVYDDLVGDLRDSVYSYAAAFTVPVQVSPDANAAVPISGYVSVDGATVVLAFDKPVTSSASPVSFSGFTLETSGGSCTFAYQSGAGSRYLTFATTRPIVGTETVRVLYAPGSLVDVSGNVVLTFALSVNNGSEITEIKYDDSKKGDLGGSWWSQVTVPAMSVRTGGSSDPDFDSATGSLLFDSTTSETVVVWFELPAGWVEGTELYALARWAKTTSADGDVAWSARYRYANVGNVLTSWSAAQVASSTLTADEDTANELHVTQLLRISIPSGRIGMVIGLELSRDPTNASDTYGADAGLYSVSLSYRTNQAGSDELFSKYLLGRTSVV